MKVALISPLDYRSGISKYSHNLFRTLLEIGVDVTLFYQAEKIYPLAERDENIKEIKRKDASTILGKFDIIHFQLGNSEFHHFQNHILGKIFNINAKKIATFHEEELRFFNLKCAGCWGSMGIHRIFNIFRRDTFRRIISNPTDRAREISEIWARRMDGLIFHSHYLSNRVRTKLDFKCSSKVIYHIGYFEEPEGSKEGGELKIYVPGFLTPTKSIYFLLDSLNQINYDFKLIINSSPIRGGEDMKALRSKIKSLGMENRIVTTSFLDDVEFVNMFRRADIILIPRRVTLGETSGGMIHGLCMGKPIVGPNIGGYPEYLSGHGLLSGPNPASWIEIIEKLLGNREMRGHLGSKAKEFARKFLSSERIAREHEEFYLDVLNEPSSMHACI